MRNLLFASTLVLPCMARPLHAFAVEVTRLNSIEVSGRGDDLLGVADTATQASTGAKELSFRALARPGEIMETVPGLIITQHDGGGKANQYYLRGFNLDHGTDLATRVDGVPVNLPSHAHGQGYTDINWVIPELVRAVEFEKGPFFPEFGDFANAGNVNIVYQNQMPQNLAVAEGGTLGFARGLIAASHAFAPGTLLYALELSHMDGAWTKPDDYRKINGLARFGHGKDLNQAGTGYSVSAQGYYGQWVGSEQVPERAIDAGQIGRFGTLDPTDGGLTHRISTYGEWHRQDEDSATVIKAYLIHYGLDLYSNFTYFLDQVHGDQIQQKEARLVGGADLKHTFFGQLAGAASDTAVGMQVRRDEVDMNLNRTDQRAYVNNVRSDAIDESNLAAWMNNKTQWSAWGRSSAGLRLDRFEFKDQSQDSANSGHRSAVAVSPKLGFVFGPFAKTEIYTSVATGVRTTDARGIFLTRDPGGGPSLNVPPIIRSRAAELGVRNSSINGYRTSLALWLIDTDSETSFSADSGSVEDTGRPGRRLGLEWENYADLRGWLIVDADASLSRSRFTGRSVIDPGTHIPDAVTSSVAAGVTLHDGPLGAGCFAGLRLRYFGPRDLTTTADQHSASSAVLNFSGGYKISRQFLVRLEVLNLMNVKYNDAEYFAESRLKGEAAGPGADGGRDDHMVHPGEPFSARLGLTAYF